MASISSENLQAAVRKFTSQLTPTQHKEQDVKSITHSALTLMRQLPVARNAVLSYFGRRFDDAANRYLQHRIEKINGNLFNIQSYNEQNTYESLFPIASSFQELLTDKSWAPQLSKWSIDLLGHISKKLMSNNATTLASVTNTVEEKLELWMACSATKILIEITSSCFSVLIDEKSSVDECVDSLLDASIRYAPHFDWVVAHLGSCFPMTIIDRVLNAGFKDFVMLSPQGSSKFSSACAILGYLSGQHKSVARQCVITYLQNSLSQPPPAAAASTTYLLNVASLSIMVSRAVTPDLASILNIQTLNCLVSHFAVGPHDTQSLLRLCIHLLMRLDQTALSVVTLLLDLSSGSAVECGHTTLKPEAMTAAQWILTHLSNELLKVTVCNRISAKPAAEVSTLKFLILGYKSLLRRLYRTKATLWEDKIICKLLLACCWNSGITTAVEILNDLLSVNKSWLIKTFDSMLQQVSVKYHSIIHSLCDKMFAEKKMDKLALDNCLEYMQLASATSENFQKILYVDYSKKLAAAIENLFEDEPRYAISYAEFIKRGHRVSPSTVPPCDMLLKWYLLSLSTQTYSSLKHLEDAVVICCSFSLAILSSCVHTILKESNKRVVNENQLSADVSLSEQNMQLSKRVLVPPTRTYILHAGQIGKGKITPSANVTEEALLMQTQLLTSLIIRCCEEKSAFTPTDAKELLSRILLNICTPDAIAAKTQWHDPITHERELAVVRCVNERPLVWVLLQYVCSYKACFATVAILIRCQIASLCTAWSKCQQSDSTTCSNLVKGTEKVLAFLTRAQLLPIPLTYIGEIVPHVACFEVKLLLEIIMRYLQMSLSKGLTLDPLEHDDMKTLQSIVQQNISKLAEISTKFLVIE